MQRRGHLGSSGKRRGAIELGIEHGHDDGTYAAGSLWWYVKTNGAPGFKALVKC